MKTILCSLLLTGCLVQPIGSPVDAGSQPLQPVVASREPSFCDDYASAYCDRSIRCGETSSNGRDDCLTFIAGACPAAPYVKPDPARALDCLTSLATSGCRSSVQCGAVFVGQVDSGDSCRVSSDCKNATDSCAGSGCKMSCQPSGGLGQPCQRDFRCDVGLECDWPTKTCLIPRGAGGAGTSCAFNGQCDDTAYCDFTAFTCAALPTAGHPCLLIPFGRCGTATQCAGSAYCVASLCQPRLLQGVACSGPESCEKSLFCDGTCKARGGPGTTCGQVNECLAGLRCASGVCSAPKAAGQSCASTPDCVDGLGCDRLLRTCTQYVFGMKPGDTCTNDTLFCGGHLVCKLEGGPGTCVELAIGDRCNPDSFQPCSALAFCKRATRTCVAGDPEVCTPNSDGGLTCGALKAAGEPCNADSQCASPLGCVPQKTGGPRCGRRGELGQDCAINKSLEQNCLFPLMCTNGTCQHAGGPREACLPGGVCLAGACQNGRCGPRLPAGSQCGSINAACESHDCSNGTCLDACH